MNENIIIRNVPAANALHKVPGFDPLQHLSKTVNKDGSPVMRLDLPYKRLWFRLACPNGRLLLNPLRVTDQMAIFEAQVFFNRDDTKPASSFTSDKKAKEVRNYIRAAQDEALNVALDNAGFGIQLCDVTQASDGGQYGSNVSLAQSADRRQEQAVQTAAPTQTVEKPQVQEVDHATSQVSQTVRQKEAAPAQKPGEQPVKEAVTTNHATIAAERPAAETVESEPKPKEAPAPVQTEQQQQIKLVEEHQVEAPQSDSIKSVTMVLSFPTSRSGAVQKETPAPIDNAAETSEPEVSVQTAPSYTDDMPVEEILQRMTLEEALAFQVKTGTCKGWTLAQVAESRPSSLNFYTNSCCKGGNVLKAAATLVLRERGQQKAG